MTGVRRRGGSGIDDIGAAGRILERTAGGIMMICCSGTKGTRLVLDI
ncbi:hypothetical protein ACFV2U_12480 [Streptomyces sp. NPDC059697]